MNRKSVFQLYGGFEIMLTRAGRIPEDIADRFWNDQKDKDEKKKFKNGYGVYVFYRQYGGSRYTPLYIGKAAGNKGFEQEIFVADKTQKYERAITPDDRSKPIKGQYKLIFLVLDLISPKNHKTLQLKKYHESVIGEMEKNLILQGYLKNSQLQNDHYTESQIRKWEVKGEKARKKSKLYKTYKAIFE